jgi:hypothetical protein
LSAGAEIAATLGNAEFESSASTPISPVTRRLILTDIPLD